MAVVLRSSSPSYLPLAATKVLYSGMLKESIDHSPRPVPSLASLTMGSTAFLKHCLLRSPVRGSCFSRCSAAAASRRLLIMRARQPQIMGSTDMPMSVRSSAGSQMPAKPMRLPSMESGLMTTERSPSRPRALLVSGRSCLKASMSEMMNPWPSRKASSMSERAESGRFFTRPLPLSLFDQRKVLSEVPLPFDSKMKTDEALKIVPSSRRNALMAEVGSISPPAEAIAALILAVMPARSLEPCLDGDASSPENPNFPYFSIFMSSVQHFL